MQTQIDFFAPQAEICRDIGIKCAIDNADRKFDGWSNEALRYLIDFLPIVGSAYFMAEEVRAYARMKGLTDPPSHRAWGAVIIKAKRIGLIQFVCFKPTSNPVAHRTPATLWKKA